MKKLIIILAVLFAASSPLIDAGATAGTDIGPYEFQESFVYGSGRLNTNVHGKDGVGDTNVYRP